IVSAAIDAPVSDSISTPVFQVVFTSTSTSIDSVLIETPTLTWSIGIGWQYGSKSQVRLAPIVAEILAASTMLPFGDFPSLIKLTVLGLTFTIARAVAILRVSGLSPTSNIPIFLYQPPPPNGLPFAQMPPLWPAIISFFHIGTSVLILSIAYLPASRASARCPEDTATATLTSPTFKLPILCTAANFFKFHLLTASISILAMACSAILMYAS